MRTSFHKQLIMAFVACLILATQGYAQFGMSRTGAKFPATVKAHIEPSVAFPGEQVRLDVTVSLDEGHYIYAFDPGAIGPVGTSLNLDETLVLKTVEGADWSQPEPDNKHDKGFDAQVNYHDEKVTFSRMFHIADVSAADYTVNGSIRMQICTADYCLPPRNFPFDAAIKINARGGEIAVEDTETTAVAEVIEPTDEGAAPIIPAIVEPEKPAASPAQIEEPALPRAPVRFQQQNDLSNAGFVTLIWTAFIAGLVALMTPCVFPLIPITISFFTKRSSHSAGQRIGLLGVYSGSIVLGFALLGFGLAIVLKSLNVSVGSGVMAQIAANPWLNLFLAFVFAMFAFSLFGMFDIALPQSWANKLQQKQAGRTDAIGAILLAVIFVIVSFTCTAPIVGPLIVLAFEGHWLRPFVGLTAYGVGFAAPFFILGLVPSAIKAMPKSGTWLNATKVTMGLIEVALALKFLSNTDLVWEWGVFTREVLLAAWAAIALVTTVYLLGTFRLHHDTELHSIGPVRLAMSLLFGSLAIYFAYGLFAGQLHSSIESLLPPSRNVGIVSAGSVPQDEQKHIINDLDKAQAIAREENKPLFIDFTGWTCTNCRLNEIEVFPKPEVKRLLDEYVVVKLYTDDATHGEKYQRYQEKMFKTFAIPYYVTMTPQNQVIAEFGGLIRDESEFVRFLEMAVE